MRVQVWAAISCCFLALALAGGCARAPRPAPAWATTGLSVRADGTLLQDGQPFRGIGVNYFDAFYRTLQDPRDTSYRAGFAELGRLGIPFARVMACGFWPVDWKLYLADRERYFRLLDSVVRAAEESRVGLILSLFWFSATVPDLVGEPRDQWGNPDSKTQAFMRRYVGEVVDRYRTSPAVWGWEFGNEYNLDADLPNAAEHRPQAVPKLGTPKSRSARDDLTHDALAAAFRAFAAEVRSHDPRRILSTGNSLPRQSAWHQWKEGTWGQDTEEQFAERLLLDNPDPIDVVSVHLYHHTRPRFGRPVDYGELVRLARDAAARAGKPLFLGEFGAWEKGPEGEAVARRRFAELLAAIEGAEVPLAALWVYDYRGQGTTWNVTPTGPRAYQLEAVAAANRRIKARPRKE